MYGRPGSNVIIIIFCHAYTQSRVSVIAAKFNDTSPFYYWPQNITIADDGDSTLELLCMIHDCDNGPLLVIRGYFFSDRTHSELVEAQCKKVNDEYVGIWFLRMKSTLKYETRNYINMTAGEEPVPMWCRTAGGANSTISYIHIKSNRCYENVQTIVMVRDNSTEGGCNNVTKLMVPLELPKLFQV